MMVVWYLFQTPTQGPMDQRATSMYSPVGPGYPVNQAKSECDFLF